jgi:hypothetical protein
MECGYCGGEARSQDAFCSTACREAWWMDGDDKQMLPFSRRPEWN